MTTMTTLFQAPAAENFQASAQTSPQEVWSLNLVFLHVLLQTRGSPPTPLGPSLNYDNTFVVKHSENVNNDNNDNTFQAPAGAAEPDVDVDDVESVASNGSNQDTDMDSGTDIDYNDEFDPSEVTEEAEQGDFTYVEAPFNREVTKRWSNRLAMRQLRYGCLSWADVLGGLSRRALSSKQCREKNLPHGHWTLDRFKEPATPALLGLRGLLEPSADRTCSDEQLKHEKVDGQLRGLSVFAGTFGGFSFMTTLRVFFFF